MLLNILQELGFNPKEQQVMACLISNPPMPASLVAKRTRLKRPTAYSIIEHLIEQGLVIRQRKDQVSFFTSVSPELISGILESRAKNKYQNFIQSTKELNQLLSQKQRNDFDLSGFRIEVLKSYDAIYDQVFRVLTSGDFDGIFNPQKVFHSLSEKRTIKKFLEQTTNSKAKIREIIVRGKEACWYKEQIVNPNHLIKEIDQDEQVLSDLIITDKFVIISHYQEPDAVAIKINHPEFLITQKSIFNLLWERL